MMANPRIQCDALRMGFDRSNFFLFAASLCASACGAAVSPMGDGATDARADAGPADVVPIDDRPSGVCSTPPPMELRVPRVSRQSVMIPIAVTLAGQGCSCTATASASDTTIESRVCGCQNQLPCVDPGYVVNLIAPSRAPDSDATFVAGSQRAEHRTISSTHNCAGGRGTISAVRVVQDQNLMPSPLRWVWLSVEGTIERCAAMPLALVTATIGETISLTVEDCNNTDCDGPTQPRPYRVWTTLRVLPRGRHTITYPGGSQTFTVD
jgi:hypothetical protein